VYKNNDLLYVSINSLHKISRYIGKDGSAPSLSKLGSDTWNNLKRKAKKKIKDIAGELIKLYAERKAAQGFAFPPDGYLQNELEASFIYEDTPDQFKATQDVKDDMMREFPMDRLICGDVGFGKTEVAVRAAFKSAVSGKQTAILVPTTILALQHYNTFKGRLQEFGVEVDYINRFKTTAQRKEVMQQLKDGKVDIVIGTHALLNKEMGFKDLGLLVVDEEQKFGVAAKEKLRRLKVNVDTLTLTATPIPRTLQFSLLGARDLSIIRTPPPNRQPIHTERRVFDDGLIKEAIQYEVHRGGQVFFVHNRVKSLPDVLVMLQKLCPDVSFAMAHGQMEPRKLEDTLMDFIDGNIDVLVSTNIIESGLDIPNTNTIIINNAHQFGLSDLHQLRGRVGRSNQKAYCYLFAPPLSVLTPESRKRLRTLEEFSDLGSGFDIAMRDLDIRGAGNLLGAEQSGFITDIGYDTYQKILEEAMQELKENEYRDLYEEELAQQKEFVREVQIETDVEMLIPDEYVSNIAERLRLYTELDEIATEEGIVAFQNALTDRFGKMPVIVSELFEGLRIRWHCKALGVDRVILKNDKLRCFFVQNPQSMYYESEIFKNFLAFMGSHGPIHNLILKQSGTNLILIKENVRSLAQARGVLQNILQTIGETHVASTEQAEIS
jgi:transcription-repair coupling factor (superfamily II helicase)